MLYMIGDKIVEITKADKSYGWNNIIPPDMTVCNDVEGFMSFEICAVQNIIPVTDKSFYYVMRSTETTDFLYRFSSWTMGELFEGAEVLVRMLSPFG